MKVFYDKYLREYHSIMENEKALSYNKMAFSADYKKNYEIYIDLIDSIINKNGKISILNIGFGPALLEKFLLNKFKNNIEIHSIDNSRTFYKKASYFLKSEIKDKRILLEIKDFEKNDIPSNYYDLVLSRDLNHHIKDLRIYFKKIKCCIKKEGLVLMEDLRFDADDDTILNFVKLVLNLKVFKNDRILMYFKLIGLIESFAVSYKIEDIIDKLKNNRFEFYAFLTNSRYHIFLCNNKKVISYYKNYFNDFQHKLNGKIIDGKGIIKTNKIC